MKILASDFDDTLYLADDIEATNRNVLAIRKFVKQGNIFCIITGRNFADLKVLLQAYKIPYTYLVCEDGAQIFNHFDYCIETIRLSRSEIESIVEILKEEGCDYYLDDGYNETEYLEDVVKIVVNCEDEKEKERLVSFIKGKVDVHIYASRYHVNIIHRSVNKRNALKSLLNLENLDYDKLYVIGDNDNDYEMLETFPGGVISKHHKVLDQLKKENYSSLCDFIEKLMKD